MSVTTTLRDRYIGHLTNPTTYLYSTDHDTDAHITATHATDPTLGPDSARAPRPETKTHARTTRSRSLTDRHPSSKRELCGFDSLRDHRIGGRVDEGIRLLI